VITIYRDLIQGSDEWLAARCGLLTASEMRLILTPTLKAANNDKSRAHLWELLAQRITKHVEPHYIGDDMMRGYEDEAIAREIYAEKYAPVEEVGFVTNDRWGYTLGCSPDGLVGDDGLIEIKSRRQKYQVQTLLENVGANTVPEDYALQVQTALLVTERKWCDFISYSGGLPMATIRIEPDPVMQEAILKAASAFEEKLSEKLAEYRLLEKSGARLLPTKRREPVQEINV
jgi:putative phage-type endonuclease